MKQKIVFQNETRKEAVLVSNFNKLHYTYKEIQMLLCCPEKDAKRILGQLREIQEDHNLVSPEGTVYSFVFFNVFSQIFNR